MPLLHYSAHDKGGNSHIIFLNTQEYGACVCKGKGGGLWGSYCAPHLLGRGAAYMPGPM